MEKKVLKMYEAPVAEIVDLELEGFLCASNVDNIDPSDDEEI
jgi:hypothetical protein